MSAIHLAHRCSGSTWKVEESSILFLVTKQIYDGLAHTHTQRMGEIPNVVIAKGAQGFATV